MRVEQFTTRTLFPAFCFRIRQALLNTTMQSQTLTNLQHFGEQTEQTSDSYEYPAYNITTQQAEWVDEHLQQVSRTFALSLSEIRGPARYYISLAYLACRIPDTIEDEPVLSTSDKEDLLLAYHDAVLQPLCLETAIDFVTKVDECNDSITNGELPDTPDWALVRDTPKVVALLQNASQEMQNALLPSIQELTLGMRDFVRDSPDTNGILINTIDELESYCYYVAGVVGHLIIKTLLTLDEYDSLQEENREELLDLGEQYGLYLQFVNISKDVFDDYNTENSIFVPQDTLQKHDVPVNDLTNEAYHEQIGDAVKEVITHATQYEQAAHEFLNHLGKDNETVRIGFSLPYVLAVATFREVQTNAVEVAKDTDIKIGRGEVMWAVEQLHEGKPAPELADKVRTTPQSL